MNENTKEHDTGVEEARDLLDLTADELQQVSGGRVVYRSPTWGGFTLWLGSMFSYLCIEGGSGHYVGGDNAAAGVRG